MRAVQLVAPGVLEVSEVPVPQPGPGEVLLRVAAAGLCHSDIGLRHLPVAMFGLPLTLGHETAGHIAEIGPGVHGWSVGDAALVHLVWACGTCLPCERGDDNLCHRAGRAAQPPTPGLGPPGGMADYMVVPAQYLLALGDLDPVSAAPLADAGMTAHHAIRNSRDVLRQEATALVIGIGGLGHVAVQLLARLCMVHTVAVDISDRKLRAADRYGARMCLTPDSESAAKILDATDGRGVDAVFDFVGTQSTIDLAARTVAPGGVYQLVGIGGGTVSVPSAPRFGDGWPYGARLQSSYGGTRSDAEACIKLASQGDLTIDTETFSIDDAVAAFDKLEQGTVVGRAVLCP